VKVTLLKRTYSADVVLDLDFKVRSYSHAAMGGPYQAVIEATGGEMQLWGLIDRIRAPVLIHSDKGDLVWWGYLSDVQATVKPAAGPGKVRVGVSVENMFNRIFVAYMLIDPTAGDERESTTWADSLESQAEYGIKELLWTKSAATQEHAEAARDRKLADMEYPIPALTLAADGESSATLTCRGWWSTLGWRYYGNSTETTLDTAEQVEYICTQKGQFFSGVDRDISSGLDLIEYRDGDATALYEALALLELGTTNYRRMLVHVGPTRRLRIYEEPERTFGPELYMDNTGRLFNRYGSQLRKELCPAGVWLMMKDIIPSSVVSRSSIDPALAFVEVMEYQVEADKLVPTFRDQPDPWEFPKVIDG
jgi:hypothetical protein